MEHARHHPGYQGAYLAGSTTWLPDDAALAPASDVDVVVVVSWHKPPLKLGKFCHLGALLEVRYLSWAEIPSADEVLADYHMAYHVRVDTIIDDPTGHLRPLQAQVSRGFAERAWVRRRCEGARRRIEYGMETLDTSAPFHDLVMAWAFPTSVTAHVVLVAALRNPTVRRRYVAAREVLSEYGHAELHPELLDLLGCAHLTRDRVRHHLTELTRTFDATAPVSRTPFFFSTDITPAARPIAIGGSQELIDQGSHREAYFWIVATFARCHKILAADAPDLGTSLFPAFEAAVADLGITRADDFPRRADSVIRFLPRLWRTTEAILSANQGIRSPHER